MANPTPSSWRNVLVGWALSLLAVAVALHLAAVLLRSVEPELIGLGVAAAVGYVAYLVHRFLRSRW